MSVTPRLNRLFATDGRCFSVAIDHGFFNEWAFLAGIENLRRVIETVVKANPDTVQLSVGQASLLQGMRGKQKPALALRVDTGNMYGKVLPRHVFSQLMDNAVELSLLLDAACVVVNLLLMPEQPEMYHDCVANVCKLKGVCERYGMPLMVEPLSMRSAEKAMGYTVDGSLERMAPLVRQAVELGADVIKADPTTDVSQYHRVIEMASGVPVLVRGGGRVSDEEILRRTRELMDQGAAGIVYGRNVIQHPHPECMVRALMAVVHDGADVHQGMNLLRQG